METGRQVGATPGTDSFLALTPDVVLEAVEAGGLETTALCYPLNSFENRVYEIELTDKSRVVAKFYRPGRWTEEQILEEHLFLQELEKAELPVCSMLSFSDGQTLKSIDGIYYSLAERKAGRAPDELSDDQVFRLGMLIGRLHNVGAERDAPTRLRLDADTYSRSPIHWLRSNQGVAQAFAERYFAAAATIADMAEQRLRGAVVQRVHGDLHLGNVLLRDQELRLLDFDDMVIAPPAQDIWLALPGRDEDTLRQRQVLLDGYERFRAFDRSTVTLIEPLRGLRLIHYAAWLARRWHDPAFQQAWPHFGSVDYWRQETEDLEDLIRLMESEKPSLDPSGTMSYVPRPAEETLLSNKDYFFDWEED